MIIYAHSIIILEVFPVIALKIGTSLKEKLFNCYHSLLSRRHVEIFFSYFGGKEKICIKCQTLFSG